MNQLWQTLMGVGRSPGDAVGESRLDLSSAPQGAATLLVILASIALLAFLWRLNGIESRELTKARKTALVVLRAITLLAVLAMLLEPVLVTSHRETQPSHLAVIFDDSESMKFSDPYTDESKAARPASELKIPSDGGRSPVQRLRETPRLDLAKSALAANLDALKRGRELHLYDLESAARSLPNSSTKARKLEHIKPNRPVSPLG
ncbi:vWA domain-containing protein, partial [Singulisphaera rosea]